MQLYFLFANTYSHTHADKLYTATCRYLNCGNFSNYWSQPLKPFTLIIYFHFYALHTYVHTKLHTYLISSEVPGNILHVFRSPINTGALFLCLRSFFPHYLASLLTHTSVYIYSYLLMYICMPTHFISVHIFISININRCPAPLILLRSWQFAPLCMRVRVRTCMVWTFFGFCRCYFACQRKFLFIQVLSFIYSFVIPFWWLVLHWLLPLPLLDHSLSYAGCYLLIST